MTQPDFDRWLDNLLNLIERRTFCALIVDFRAYTSAPPGQDAGTQIKIDRAERVEKYRRFAQTHRDALRRYMACVCYIVEPGPLRAVLSGMLVASNLPYPTRIVGTVAEAEHFCNAKLGREQSIQE